MTKENQFIAREGYFIIAVSLTVALVLFILNLWVGFAGVFWVLFCLYFFRNPRRLKQYDQGHLIAPADGRVIFVGEAIETHFFKKQMQKISIFMSPFNVHVNRAPATGEVRDHLYCSGSFKAAFDQNAGNCNERSAVYMVTHDQNDIVFVQVAGWFARRIVTYPQKGQTITQGHIIGMIKFGSRMDIYYPAGYQPRVKINQRVRAGDTVIAVKED